MTVPPPVRSSLHSAATFGSTMQPMSAASRTLRIATPSAVVGGTTSTRDSAAGSRAERRRACYSYLHEAPALPDIGRYSRQDALEIVERLADDDAALVHVELADGPLVVAVALLDDGDCAAHRARALRSSETG